MIQPQACAGCSHGGLASEQFSALRPIQDNISEIALPKARGQDEFTMKGGRHCLAACWARSSNFFTRIGITNGCSVVTI